MSLLFCTTNADKFNLGQRMFKKHGLTLEQLHIEVDEIQHENPGIILKHKAQAIYDKVQKPLFVTDDSWDIPALNGFPGPYMKSVNHWFTPETWIKLMGNYDNKKVYMHSRLAFIDSGGIVSFEDVQERTFSAKASKVKSGPPILQVVTLPGDSTPLNELWLKNSEKLLDGRTLWEEFIKWHKVNYA